MKKVSEMSLVERMAKAHECDTKFEEYMEKRDAILKAAKKIANFDCKKFLVKLAQFYSDKAGEMWLVGSDYSLGIDKDYTGLFPKEFSEEDYSYLNYDGVLSA